MSRPDAVLPTEIYPILQDPPYRDAKDPCPVFDGQQWHIYGSGGSSLIEHWEILHATAPDLRGKWSAHTAAELHGVNGVHVAAPGVVHENNLFHMFVQTEFMTPSGTIEYLTSQDGISFERVNTALLPLPDSNEAGIYDAHPAIVNGHKYLTYAGFSPTSKDCNLYLAQSATNEWAGPWQRLGQLINHRQVAFHNQPEDSDYEWGLEGPQLLELSDHSLLLTAVCFLRGQPAGKRQRVFLSRAGGLGQPFEILEPVLTPSGEEWQSGENGHAAAVALGGLIYLFFQARSCQPDPKWRYGIATFNEADFLKIAAPAAYVA